MHALSITQEDMHKDRLKINKMSWYNQTDNISISIVEFNIHFALYLTVKEFYIDKYIYT